MVTKPQYKKFLELILSLTEEEKEIISDFTERFETKIEHQKKILKLIRWSKKLRKGYSYKIKTHVEDLIKSFEEILQKFNSILQKEISFDLRGKRLIEKEIETGKKVEEILAYDYNGIKEKIESGGPLSGGKAEEDLKRILEGIHEAIKKEYEEISLNEYLKKLLDNFRTILNEEGKLLQQELNCLKVYEFKQILITPEFAKELENNENKLKELIEQINGLLKREKEEFIDPFNKFLKEKTILDKTIESLATKNKITFENVLADIRMFTRPGEVSAYQNELTYNYFDRLDKRAKKLLYRVAKRAADVGEKEKKKLGKEAQMAVVDTLTRTGNRHYFDIRICEEIKRYRRYKQIFSLIMIDMDFFKKFNDVYGHGVGDIVLAETAGFIKKAIRKTDKLFRYGGEEFMVILPGTNKQSASIVAEKIRTSVESESVPLIEKENEKRKDIKKSKKRKNITLSLGVAAFPEDGDDKNKLLEAVDAALYASKRGGRNRVTLTKLAVVKKSAVRRLFSKVFGG